MTGIKKKTGTKNENTASFPIIYDETEEYGDEYAEFQRLCDAADIHGFEYAMHMAM